MQDFLPLQISLARNLEGQRPNLQAAAKDADAIGKYWYRVAKRTSAHLRPAIYRQASDEFDIAKSRITYLNCTLADVYCFGLRLVEGVFALKTREWHRASLLINDLVCELDGLRARTEDPNFRAVIDNDRLLARCSKTKWLAATGKEWRALCLLKWTWRRSRGTSVHPFVSRLYRERLLSAGQVEAAKWLDAPASMNDSLCSNRRWTIDPFLWKEPRMRSSRSDVIPTLWPPLLFWSMNELNNDDFRRALEEAKARYGTSRRAATALGWHPAKVDALLSLPPLLDPNGGEVASLTLRAVEGQDRAKLNEQLSELRYGVVQGLGNHYDAEEFFETSYRTLGRIESRLRGLDDQRQG